MQCGVLRLIQAPQSAPQKVPVGFLITQLVAPWRSACTYMSPGKETARSVKHVVTTQTTRAKDKVPGTSGKQLSCLQETRWEESFSPPQVPQAGSAPLLSTQPTLTAGCSLPQHWADNTNTHTHRALRIHHYQKPFCQSLSPTTKQSDLPVSSLDIQKKATDNTLLNYSPGLRYRFTISSFCCWSLPAITR